MTGMWVEMVGREPWRFRSEHGEFEAFPDELGDGPPPPVAAFFEERGYLDVRRRRVVVGIGDPTVEHFADVELGGRTWTYRLYPAAAATPIEWITAGYEAPGRFAVGLLLDLAESPAEGWYVETKQCGDDEWFCQRITDPADLEEVVRTFAVQGDDMLRVTRILDQTPVAPSTPSVNVADPPSLRRHS